MGFPAPPPPAYLQDIVDGKVLRSSTNSIVMNCMVMKSLSRLLLPQGYICGVKRGKVAMSVASVLKGGG